MKKGPVYLHLSRSSREPRVTPTDHPSVGLVFGPYQSIRFGEDRRIYMEGTTNSDVLRLWDGCGAYDGAYYHEWSVRSFPAGSVAAYDPMKVEAPPGVTEPSSLSLQERFERVVLLCESVIEDRLSILREKDPVEREVLLTTDIDDQIGYWQWVEKELSSLK